ncbi:MAG: TetR family transcriptional regulator [Acidobacteria bacterium]|nr:TetR family transcriptional regulator [Acidobacteriota bacterium]
MRTREPRLGTRGQPELSRAAILQAAVREFAREGVSAARTDAIARSAGVNKALLYYYFKDKEALYQAVLEQVFNGLRAAVHDALTERLPPRARLGSYLRAHFDYIASNPLYPRIVQAEFLRAGRDPSRLERIAKNYFRPLFKEISALLEEGAECGDFRRVNAIHFIPSMVAVIVFYFTTAPVMKIISGSDPLSPDALGERRRAVVDFISAALFAPGKKEGHSERAR